MTVIGFIGGHGGEKRGAVIEGLDEADLALNTSTLCVWHCEVPDAAPALLRDKDITMDFAMRNAAAIANNCSLVVELHYDSNPNPMLTGSAVYTYPTNQKAEQIAKNIMAEMPEYLRTGKHFRTNPNDWRKRAHRVVSAYTCPTILIECAMLSNAGDRAYLKRHGSVGEIAQGICRGLVGAPQVLRTKP